MSGSRRQPVFHNRAFYRLDYRDNEEEDADEPVTEELVEELERIMAPWNGENLGPEVLFPVIAELNGFLMLHYNCMKHFPITSETLSLISSGMLEDDAGVRSGPVYETINLLNMIVAFMERHGHDFDVFAGVEVEAWLMSILQCPIDLGAAQCIINTLCRMSSSSNENLIQRMADHGIVTMLIDMMSFVCPTFIPGRGETEMTCPWNYSNIDELTSAIAQPLAQIACNVMKRSHIMGVKMLPALLTLCSGFVTQFSNEGVQYYALKALAHATVYGCSEVWETLRKRNFFQGLEQWMKTERLQFPTAILIQNLLCESPDDEHTRCLYAKGKLMEILIYEMSSEDLKMRDIGYKSLRNLLVDSRDVEGYNYTLECFRAPGFLETLAGALQDREFQDKKEIIDLIVLIIGDENALYRGMHAEASQRIDFVETFFPVFEMDAEEGICEILEIFIATISELEDVSHDMAQAFCERLYEEGILDIIEEKGDGDKSMYPGLAALRTAIQDVLGIVEED